MFIFVSIAKKQSSYSYKKTIIKTLTRKKGKLEFEDVKTDLLT